MPILDSVRGPALPLGILMLPAGIGERRMSIKGARAEPHGTGWDTHALAASPGCLLPSTFVLEICSEALWFRVQIEEGKYIHARSQDIFGVIIA